ncbi:MAG TPA: hypothetical protein VGK71_05155 [Nitrospirota bacterium]
MPPITVSSRQPNSPNIICPASWKTRSTWLRKWPAYGSFAQPMPYIAQRIRKASLKYFMA